MNSVQYFHHNKKKFENLKMQLGSNGKIITVFCTSPLPCSGGHGPPSGPWPWAVINAASQYGTLRNNSYAGGSTYSKSFTYLPQKKCAERARGGNHTALYEARIIFWNTYRSIEVRRSHGRVNLQFLVRT